MEIYERIQYLRKEVLKLSREKFGSAVGVSADVINNIERGRLQNPEQKEPIYRLICEKFGVSLEWLKDGTGDMFPPKTRGEEIGEIVKAAAKNSKDEAIAFFQNLLAELSDAEILLMYEIFKNHFPG